VFLLSSSSIAARLARRTFFSAGRRLGNAQWSEPRNREVYGLGVGPHGQEFALEASFGGPIGARDGMIVNLVDLKPLLARAMAPLENAWLERGLEPFPDSQPTAENIALWLWSRLPPRYEGASLCKLQLRESRFTAVEITRSQVEVESKIVLVMKVCRSYEFAAAHRLFVPELSPEENLVRFDKCSNPAGHGHNYGLDIWIEGAPDPASGFIITPSRLDGLVDEEVYARFDHKHLNVDCPEFSEAGLVPTSENLARLIFELLGARLQREGYALARVGLRETHKNYFEVEA